MILRFSRPFFRHQFNKNHKALTNFRLVAQTKQICIHFPSGIDYLSSTICINTLPKQFQFCLKVKSLFNEQNIIVKMERKEYTPTKQSKIFPTSTSYNASQPRQSFRTNSELAIVREFQALKLQARQLETQNRQLISEVEKLRHEKSLHQSKLLQKASFEEEAINQFQKEKTYHIEMVKLKNEEDLNRIKRDYQTRLDELQREIKNRQLLNKEICEKNAFTESKVGELRNHLEHLEVQLMQFRQNSSNLTEQVTREEFAIKKLEMLAQELERQKNQMQAEIHILLDIQAEKCRAISNLEIELDESLNDQKSQEQKLTLLTENFLSLQQHITVMKDRLGNADFRGSQLDNSLKNIEYMIADKQQLIFEQKQREFRLREQIKSHKQRQSQRIMQIQHLMAENERIYRDLGTIRYKLYDVSIEQGVDI